MLELLLAKKKQIIIGLAALVTLWSSIYVVDPGNRGVIVTMGSVSEHFKNQGVGLKLPFFSSVNEVSIRQHTQEVKAECYSSNLQQVKGTIKVLFRIPEESVVDIFQKYAGDPFDSLVAPRVQEALKEVAALQTAENIVKNRETIKQDTLEKAKKKIGGLVVIEDVVVENIDLSDDLEKAIESKMVQDQEQQKAVFIKQKAQIDAETALIRAQGEANAIRVRGQAIRENPMLIQLQIAEKWNGVAPLVVGAGQGANILLPVGGK